MPAGHICDGGCGHAGPIEDFTELGVVKKRLYCDDCVESVRAYMAAVDQLHIDSAQAFIKGREALILAWHRGHRSGVLPS